MHIQFNY